MNKLLSIIVPVYQVEQYLRECLDSIRRQTYSNFECILVDDGSKDQGGLICDEYEQLDSRFKVIHQKNQGLGAARNAGINIMQGEYVTFVDSDDYLADNFCEVLIDYLEEKKLNLVSCDSYDFDDLTREEIKQKPSINQIFNHDQAIQNLLTKQSFTFEPVQQKVYRRYIFDEIKFNEKYIHEDTIITPQLYDQAKKIGHLNSRLYFYRVRQNSIMQKKYGIRNVDNIYAFDLVASFIKLYYPVYYGLILNKLSGTIIYNLIWANNTNNKEKNEIIKICNKYIKNLEFTKISSFSKKNMLLLYVKLPVIFNCLGKLIFLLRGGR